MKVYYLLVSAFCAWITPTHSQFFYSHYTPLTQVAPLFPQTYIPAVTPLAYTANPATSVTYNIPAAPAAAFRGFGYRTDYKDGASSTVFYVTGAEAENLRNFKDFPNFTRKIDESAGKARSLASDIIDINAVPDAQGKIQSVLQPAEFQQLFDNALPGVINFYSFPASTVPLALARQLNVTANVTTTTTAPASEEAVAAESVINSNVIVNNVEELIKSNGTTESTTAADATESVTESKVTEPSTTTENAEAKEKSTEETTTPESTTQV